MLRCGVFTHASNRVCALQKMLEVICLIPELSFMTGLSDEMRSDYKVMKVTITPSTIQLKYHCCSCNMLGALPS